MMKDINFLCNRSTPIKLQKISRLSRVGFDENETTVKLPERVIFFFIGKMYKLKIKYTFLLRIYFRNLIAQSHLIVKVVWWKIKVNLKRILN